MSLHPGLKRLGYSVRPLRGHWKMSKLQGLQSSAAVTRPAKDCIYAQPRPQSAQKHSAQSSCTRNACNLDFAPWLLSQKRF